MWAHLSASRVSQMLLGHQVLCYRPCDVEHALSRQISQVCQLCQQSPRLFSNHAAQLHTLLVSAPGCLPPAPFQLVIP